MRIQIYLYIAGYSNNKIVEIMSLTSEKIIQFAKENNARFEAYTPIFDRFGDRIFGKISTIGIELKPHVWFWWYDYNDGDVFFSHRYNQANGATIRSFNQGWKAEQKITQGTKR